MDETKAMLGILVIAAIALTSYFVIGPGNTGLATNQNYITCCCNILTQDTTQVLVRSQLQTFATRTTPDCQSACEYNYAGQGKIFSQVGTCAENQ